MESNFYLASNAFENCVLGPLDTFELTSSTPFISIHRVRFIHLRIQKLNTIQNTNGTKFNVQNKSEAQKQLALKTQAHNTYIDIKFEHYYL